MAYQDLAGKYTEVEGSFDASGKQLYTKSWLPTGPVKAKLVHIHGYSDHMGRYYEFFPTLASRGIAVHGFDQRGWGRSVTKPAEKGLTGPTATVMADIVAFIRPHLPPVAPAGADGSPSSSSCPPLFVLGHSMGGGEVLTLMCDRARGADVVSRVRGWLLESPFIGFTPELQPSRLKVAAGRLAGRVLPHFQLVEVIPPENLSRDPAVVASLRADPLCHNTGTLEGLSGMLDRTLALQGHVATLDPGAVRRLWMGHGTADKAVSFGDSKEWFETMTGQVGDRAFKAYEGHYHQLHADYGKDEFYRDVGDWILARLGGDEAERVKPAETGAEAAAAGGQKEEAKL